VCVCVCDWEKRGMNCIGLRLVLLVICCHHVPQSDKPIKLTVQLITSEVKSVCYIYICDLR